MLNYYERRNSSHDENVETGDIEAGEIHNHHPSTRIRTHMEFRQTIQLLPFAPKFQTLHAYRLAMRALPPIFRLCEHKTKLSVVFAWKNLGMESTFNHLECVFTNFICPVLILGREELSIPT